MAKIRKIYDQTIKPDGSKTTIYPITSTRAVYTPAGDTLDFLLSHGGIMHNAFDVDGYQVVSSVDDLPEEETKIGYLIKDNLYIWVGTGGDTKNGMYQNCGTYRGPEGASAYEVAVQNGYKGTEEEWLNDPVNGIKGVGVSETEIDHTDEQSGTSTIKFKYNNGEEFELAVKNGTGIVSIEEQASTEDSGVSLWTVNLSDGTSHSFNVKNGKGIASVTQETEGVGSDAPNIIRVAYSDGISATFTVKNGATGNSGYTGAAGELEVVNNITDGGAAKALSAEMGKTLKSYIDDGYEFRGAVTSTSVPSAVLSGHKVFYIAATPGTYTNFGNLEIPSDRVAVIYYNGSGSWTRALTQIPTGTRVNIASRGVFLDRGHYCSFTESGAFDGYKSSATYDSVWVNILEGATLISFTGAVTGSTGARISYFSDMIPSVANYLGYNRTGKIRKGAKLAIITFAAEDNPDGYDNISVTQNLDFLKKSYFDSIFENYLKSTPFGKNLINPDNLLSGYQTNNGKVSANASGIMSNKIELVHGQNYTLSGIPYYSTTGKVYYALYSYNDSVLGIKSVSISDPDQTGYGQGTFTFDSKGGQVAYIRICLQSSTSAQFNPSIAQLEAGDTATSYAAYVGMTSLDVEKFNAVDSDYFNSLFDKYIRSVPSGKNLLNPNAFISGYYSGGRIVESENGVLSNKLYLKNGQKYTFQGVPYYRTTGKAYYGAFDSDGNLISVVKLKVSDPEETGYGTGTFAFYSNNGLISYIRICLQAVTSASLDVNAVQLEAGEEATSIEEYSGSGEFIIENGGSGEGGESEKIATRRKVRLLCIGNSYSGDALYYVPFLLPSLADIDVEIGYLYRSGENLAGHWSNFQNDTTYSFYAYRGKGYWETIGSKTIKYALAFQQWDIILLHQQQAKTYTWSTYQPYLNNLINGIYSQLAYPVKFVWMFGQQCPVTGGTTKTDEQILTELQGSWTNSMRVLNETLCDAVIPIGTAIQNARTTYLSDLGDYGKLTEEGVHLQDGLPRQIAAYTVCMTLMELCGYSDRSVYGDINRVTEDEWFPGKNIQQRQGTAVGSTDENCRVAQTCVVMAHKHPYQITDISQMI